MVAGLSNDAHTQTALRKLREVASPLSPGHRRWVRFLHSLPLDPDQTDRFDAPARQDFIICGSPRTGTTLACAALFQPPSIVTVMEPWDGMRLPPAQLFASLRDEIDATGVLRRGRLDVDELLRDGVAKWCREGERHTVLRTDADYLLGVKWPAYWRYLELLPETKFIVCLRHPLEVVSSYKKAGGRVAAGLQYDTAFNCTLNSTLRRATREPALRRVLLFDYIHERLLPHLEAPNVLAVRYERWFEDLPGMLSDLSSFLGRDITSVPAHLRPPRSRSALTEEEVALVRTHCRTAEALGYSLDGWPEYGDVPA